MYSRKHPNHVICENCGQSFPESWIATRKAVSEGKDKYCSSFCHEQYLEGTQQCLPFGFGGQKPTVTNGHTVRLTRRIQ